MTARRVVAITGASSGIGAALAALHARDGWDVVMVNRSVERSRPVIDRIHSESPEASVDVVAADLADNDSIAAAADTLSDLARIDLFYNNAGVLLGELTDAPSGIEMHAQVNTIAPYLFGRLLHDSLVGSTVLSVTTGAINKVRALDVGELAHPSSFRKIVGPYALSKLATAALMDAFAGVYPDTTFRSAEPGAVKTPMTVGDGMPRLLVPVRNLFFSSPERGCGQAARGRDLAGPRTPQRGAGHARHGEGPPGQRR